MSSNKQSTIAKEAVHDFIEIVELSYVESIKRCKKTQNQKVALAFSGSILKAKKTLKDILNREIKNQIIIMINELLNCSPAWIFDGQEWPVKDANELYHNHYRIIGNKVKSILNQGDDE